MDFKYSQRPIPLALDIDKANFWITQSIKDEAEAFSDYGAALRMLAKAKIKDRDIAQDTYRDIAAEENQHLGEFVATLIQINEANGNTDFLEGIHEVCERVPAERRGKMLAKMCEVVEKREGQE